MRVGPQPKGSGQYEFIVLAPLLESIELKLLSPTEQSIKLSKDDYGYWKAIVDIGDTACTYMYRLNSGTDRPDPASNYQPNGVHQASAVVDHARFEWRDEAWQGLPLEQMIIYELHVGTFTNQGTFEAIVDRLDDLVDLGINAIEIMPVAQFPGDRNWGYDGVYSYAVQNSYGGPDGLKLLVDACHQKGISVVLDVVYNHIGPEGNYLPAFAPYFTDRHKTPWGSAINYDDEYSDGVRNYFIENALYWFREFHIDALRLDAVHAIYDMGAKHFLLDLSEQVAELSSQLNRPLYLIAESDLSDVRTIRPKELGGQGMDAQWLDDFHHCVHTLLTKESRGYYHDFGQFDQLIKTLREGFVYSWQYSPHRSKHCGSSSADEHGKRFVVFIQNHDQCGNRMMGERLSSLVSFEAVKLAAGAMLLSPYVPLLFMGEEYGEDAPFLYFVSHSDAPLIEGVREGRKAEFKSFSWAGEPPDPQSEETFKRSKLRWELRNQGNHRILRDFYRTLISMRKTIPALADLSKENLTVSQLNDNVLMMARQKNESSVICMFNFDAKESAFDNPFEKGVWRKILDSADEKWSVTGGSIAERIDSDSANKLTLSPFSFVVLVKESNL